MRVYWAVRYYLRYVRDWFLHRTRRCDIWCPFCYQEFDERMDRYYQEFDERMDRYE